MKELSTEKRAGVLEILESAVADLCENAGVFYNESATVQNAAGALEIADESEVLRRIIDGIARASAQIEDNRIAAASRIDPDIAILLHGVALTVSTTAPGIHPKQVTPVRPDTRKDAFLMIENIRGAIIERAGKYCEMADRAIDAEAKLGDFREGIQAVRRLLAG